MVQTKGVAAAVANWKGAQSIVRGRYEQGVRQPRRSWQAGAVASESLYQQKLQESFADQRRVKGLQKVSDGEWSKAAAEKGAARIVDGMQKAEPKFSAGIGDVISKLESITLPPRVADVAANVTNRVVPIAMGLHELKKK